MAKNATEIGKCHDSFFSVKVTVTDIWELGKSMQRIEIVRP